MTTKFTEIQYTRPDFEKIIADYAQLIKDFDNAASYQIQKDIINKINSLKKDYLSATNIVSIRHSIDTANEFYKTENDFFDENGPRFSEVDEKYYKALTHSKYRKELEAEFGSHLFVIAELSTKTFIPEILEDLKEENRLCSEYQKLKASAKIELDGKIYNLAGLSPLMESLDRDLRKRASAANSKFYVENEAKFDEIYDKLVKLRHQMALKMGYKNYVELGYIKMLRSDYTAKEIATYRNLIHQYVVPLARKINARRKEILGLDKMFQYDNLFFNDGNPTPKGTPEQIIENGKAMYDAMSKETAEFFNFMLDNELMDLVNKENKSGGGYCSMIPNIGAPFIFSNFNGTAHDVDVLTHEAGHAFQCYSSRHFEMMEYYWPTYEACEIHSMSMEFFAWPWIDRFFKEDTDKYKYYHLVKSLVFLPYGAAVDEFQQTVYENPEMTPSERKTLWRSLEKKYMPDKEIDQDDYLERGGFWQRQAHIYQSPFYYIDYTLAQVCAFQYWIKMQHDYAGAWKEYNELCKAGGSLSFLNLVKLANLQSPMEESTFSDVVGQIEGAIDQLYANYTQKKAAAGA